MSKTTLNAHEILAAGLPMDMAHEAYLEQQGLSPERLSLSEFQNQVYDSILGPDELRADPKKEAYHAFCKTLGPQVSESLRDKHGHLDPARIPAKDYEEFKKTLIHQVAPEAGAASRKARQDLLSRTDYDLLFQHLYRRAHSSPVHRNGASEQGAFAEGKGFDGERVRALLSQLECELQEVADSPATLREESLHRLTRLMGPLVPALLRDANGALDPTKVPAKSFSEFKEFLQTQTAVDGIAFNGFWLDSYKNVLGQEEFEPLLQALYQKSRGRDAGALDEDLLRRFTAALVEVSAERFVQHHMGREDGRRMLRGILGDSRHYTKDLRSDLVKAIAGVGEAQNVAAARYHALTSQISTWNYFNVAVTDDELANASRIADGILDSAEYLETESRQIQKTQAEEPERVRVLEERYAGRKISPDEIRKIQTLIQDKGKKLDPLSQTQVKLAKFWLMTVDNRLWGYGGTMGLPAHRAYLLKRTEALLKRSEGVASEAEFLALNEKLQDFLHGALQSEDSTTWNWLKDKTVGHGLAEVLEGMPETFRAPYEELKQFSDEIEHARAMGQRFRLGDLRVASGDPQVDEAARHFIQGLQQTQRSLWYGYKQHKLLSRAGSQLADVAGFGDVAEIREANQVLDQMMERLQKVKSKTDLQKEIEFLQAQLQEDGSLHRALAAAEMDGTEQIIGLGQTIAVIAAITLATKGAGTATAVAEAAETAHAIHWTARTAWGLKMGAAISAAENGLALASGEVRPGEDSLLSLAKDSASTAVAMGIFSPFAARLGHSVERNVLQRLVSRYTEGGLKQGVARFAGDTALEAGEEVFDATLRGSLDGKPQLSFDQFRELGLVSLAGGGTKMGSVVSAFRNSQRGILSKEGPRVLSDISPPSQPANGNGNGNSAAKWASAAGLTAFLSPEIAHAASGAVATGAGAWATLAVGLGMGTLGALGMSFLKPEGPESSQEAEDPIGIELEETLVELAAAAKGPNLEAPAELRKVIADNFPNAEESDVSKKILALEQAIHRFIPRENHLLAYQTLVFSLGRWGRFAEAEGLLRDGKLLARLWPKQADPHPKETEDSIRVALAICAFDHGGREGAAHPFHHLAYLEARDWEYPLSIFLDNLLRNGEPLDALSQFEELAQVFASRPSDSPFLAALRQLFSLRLRERIRNHRRSKNSG